MKFQTTSSIQTKKIARELAKSILTDSLSSQNLQFRISHKALIITLKGDLGAGKTTFTQGFLSGLGARGKITSPTFVITKNYKLPARKIRSGGQTTNYKKIYHFDCYRIHSAKEILDLNWKEIIADNKNIILIEWPERISKILPKKRVKIIFKHGKKENERELIIK